MLAVSMSIFLCCVMEQACGVGRECMCMDGYMCVYGGQRSTLDIIPKVCIPLSTGIPRGSGLSGMSKVLQLSKRKSEQDGLQGLFCGCHCPGVGGRWRAKDQGQGQQAGSGYGQPCTPI